METIMGLLAGVVAIAVATEGIYWRKEMNKEPKLPHKLKRGNRKPKYFNIGYGPGYSTQFCWAHLVGRVGRLDNKVLCVIEIHPKDAAKVRAWSAPEDLKSGDTFMEKPRAGAYYKYIKIKNIVHEES